MIYITFYVIFSMFLLLYCLLATAKSIWTKRKKEPLWGLHFGIILLVAPACAYTAFQLCLYVYLWMEGK